MMMQKQSMKAILLAIAVVASSCGQSSESSDAPRTGGKTDSVEAEAAVLPQPGAKPWGGNDATQWTPESVIANAVSTQLNAHWRQTDVVDVIVAVPTKMQSSDVHPYGDGQSNAAPSFPFWNHKAPPMVATLVVHADQSETLSIRLHGDLELSEDRIDLEVASEDSHQSFSLTGQRSEDGSLAITWNPSLALRNQSAPPLLWVTPAGWDAGFPLHFYIPTTDVSSLVSGMDASDRDFGQGRSLPDPEGLKDAAGPTFDTAMTQHRFGLGYNQEPFASADVHGTFPRHQSTSAVGKSWAWVASPPLTPFKHVYLCFEGRRPDLEALSGAPSGSGYHHIGDPAETLANTLEDSPFLVSWAAQGPALGTVFEGRSTAYQLDTVGTSRLLWPQEALITSHGGGGPFAHLPSYHWYAFHQPAPVCAEIWVHNCPSNTGLDFSCQTSQATLTIDATTFFGQDLYVVGSTAALGGWDVTRALPMSAEAYPNWSVAVPNEAASFKFIKKFGGQVTWQSGPDHKIEAGSGGHHEYSW